MTGTAWWSSEKGRRSSNHHHVRKSFYIMPLLKYTGEDFVVVGCCQVALLTLCFFYLLALWFCLFQLFLCRLLPCFWTRTPILRLCSSCVQERHVCIKTQNGIYHVTLRVKHNCLQPAFIANNRRTCYFVFTCGDDRNAHTHTHTAATGLL